MIIKFTAMAGLAAGARCLARGNAGQGPGAGAMTGLASQTGMNLNIDHIGSGRRGMAIGAEGNGAHRMRMAMIIKFSRVAGLTGCARRLADRTTGQEAGGGIVARLTGQVGGMSLHSGHIRGRAIGMAAGAQ